MYKSFIAEEEMQPQPAGLAGKPMPAEQPLVAPAPPLLRLQRAVGNRAVGRLVEGSRQAEPVAQSALESKTSGTGSGKVVFTYAPEAKDKSTKIVFIQVIHMMADGAGRKPSEFDSSINYRDADTTATFRYVDYIKGEADPYYNGDDANDIGTQGNATASPKVAATMNDTPHAPDSWFPSGAKKVKWDFRTASFSAAGADKGTFYDFIDWTYEREKSKTAKTTIGKTGTGNPGTDFMDALKLWNKNHSFTLP